MKQYNLAVMPGDFIGKEVVSEEMKVLNKTAEKYGFSFKTTDYPHGGEHYIQTKELVTDSIISELKNHDAVVFGAVGHPNLKKGEVERGILLKMRFDMGQYVNLRPSKLYKGVDAPIRKIHPNLPDDYELIVVREGTGGLYKSKGGIKSSDNFIVATQIMEYTSEEVDRINKYSFELAREKSKNGKPMNVTLALKSNVLEFVSASLWQPRFEKMAKEEYADVPSNYAHIDALNGPMLISNSPEKLGIIVTSNMFGDILTDLTASLFGGMGIGASACINPEGTSMFEPLHGSSPQDYGKNTVSPIAAILSGALMLENIGEINAAKGLELAVERVLTKQKIPNFTTNSGVSTQKQTEYVLEELMEG